MRTAPDDRREREARLPSWAGSLLLHAMLLVAVVILARSPAPEGAAEQGFREVGVVVRQPSRESLLLDITSDPVQPAVSTTESHASSDLSQALLPEPSASPFADLVSELTSEGPSPSPTEGAGAAPTPGGGRPALPLGHARTAVFGVEGAGSRFVYVFDRSISMRGAPLRAAKRELLASLSPLEPTHQLHIIFFNHRQWPFETGRGRDHFATDEVKRLAESFIAGVTADGSTDRYGALSRALRYGPDVVFFLTDADTPMSGVEISKIERLNQRSGAMICTVEFGVGPSRGERNFLVELAERTGGQYGYVDTQQLRR